MPKLRPLAVASGAGEPPRADRFPTASNPRKPKFREFLCSLTESRPWNRISCRKSGPAKPLQDRSANQWFERLHHLSDRASVPRREHDSFSPTIPQADHRCAPAQPSTAIGCELLSSKSTSDMEPRSRSPAANHAGKEIANRFLHLCVISIPEAKPEY